MLSLLYIYMEYETHFDISAKNAPMAGQVSNPGTQQTTSDMQTSPESIDGITEDWPYDVNVEFCTFDFYKQHKDEVRADPYEKVYRNFIGNSIGIESPIEPIQRFYGTFYNLIRTCIEVPYGFLYDVYSILWRFYIYFYRICTDIGIL